MQNSLFKWLIFPFLGILFAVFYLLSMENTFKGEEIKFEPRTSRPNLLTTMKGVTEVEWEGRHVLGLKEKQAFFHFSTFQPTSYVLHFKYHLRSIRGHERIKLFINNTFLKEVPLQPSSNNPNQISLIIPFHLLQAKENHLEILRAEAEPGTLYLESLKIRNYKGYSTGLLKAYILPLPLNPPLLSKINWNIHKATFLFFIFTYSLFGIVYGFILSFLHQAPFRASLGKGSLVLLPPLFFALITATISFVVAGHIILSLKSFVFINAGLTLIAMAIQLELIQPLLKFSKRSLQRILERKVLVVLFLIAITFLSVLYLYSLKFDKNITGFMVIGDYFEAPHIWTSKTLIHKGSVGYDGQFYYYIAHDPFILGHAYNHIDFPAYRYQRIIYPLTVWLLSFSQPNLIPFMMVAVNFLGILLGTYFIIQILKHYGRSPWYSLFYATIWGFLLCLLRSLPEPLSITFVIIAVFAYLKGKTTWQVLFLTLAALTQETTILVSLAFLFYCFCKKDLKDSLIMLIPSLGYFFWQLYLYAHFQTFSFLGGTQNFGFPFLGMIEKFYSLGLTGLSYEKVPELLYLMLVLFLLLTAFYDILKYYSPLTVSFLGYALLILFLNKLIWVEPWSYTRATLGLLVFNLLIFTKEGNWINLFPMYLIPIIFLMSLVSMKLL